MADVSTLGQALSLIDRIQNQQSQFSTLSAQLASGKKTQRFSGLGSDVLTTQRARADIGAISNYERNITNANRRLELTLGALDAFKGQANDFYGVAAGLSRQSDHQRGDLITFDDPATPDVVEEIRVGYSSAESDVDFRTVRDFASSTFDYLADLVNTRDGERYLFSGADTLTRPLNTTGTLDAAVETMLNEWKAGNITNEELIANITDRTTDAGNPDALTDSLIGYNATLSSGNAQSITIRVDDNSELEYTTLANEKSLRDSFAILSVLMSDALGPIADQVELDAVTGLPVVITDGAPGATTDEMRENFFVVYDALVGELNTAIDNIDESVFGLENTRARIDQIAQNYTAERALLVNTVSDIENVDLNEVAVSLQILQTQLSASFSVTALLQDLSLANFI